ncbi:DmsC/YnfH family molybdoenzyme membrane anchor subunit [Eggerthella sinensis]|uniref:DmsC/YnfH family molybdoenzyme membrane anchor subunit n=1 Tax=Eggerthella sinensis TaxID=242230 RepID=UPI0022E3ED6E|nr:DmsC/YnfH family molybdoenzyme membrane anchor subunit [Eggerthella sinensis]
MTIQWSLVLFTVLAGCGAWLFACVAIDEFRGAAAKVRVPASVAAVVLLAVGGIASATHLSHVDRMMAALAHPAPGIFLERCCWDCWRCAPSCTRCWLRVGRVRARARRWPWRARARRWPWRASCWRWRSRSRAGRRT